MASPRNPQSNAGFKERGGGGGGGMKHGEILNSLRNSPKGQLHYETGWDEKPQAVWQLISNVQAEEDSQKVAVLQRAIRACRISDQRAQRRDVSPQGTTGTSSGSGSRLTLSDNGSSQNEGNNHSFRINSDGKSPVKPRRKGYGIREDEYDDEAEAKEFEIQKAVDDFNHITFFLLNNYKKELEDKVSKESLKWQQKNEQGLKEHLEKYAPSPPPEEFDRRLQEARKSLVELHEKSIDEALKSISVADAERKQIDEEYKEKARLLKEHKAKERAAATARAAAAKAAEDRERLLKLQEQQEAEKKRLIQEAEEKRHLLEEEEERKRKEEQIAQEIAAAKKIEAEKLLLESQKEPELPTALQGFILKEDCDTYVRCNNLIQKYEESTKDISAGSAHPEIKKFYSGASKCINSPLNALANTDPTKIDEKSKHFIDLIEGRPVVGNSTMAPFNSSVHPIGKPFVLRLFAFKFVKKAESEILSEKKGFVPLAKIALDVARKFPEWGSLVQAYFYKLCPFLVPFSLPRGQQTIQEYCNSLGYDLKGNDSTLLNEMLGRVKGYCSLYAIMVQTFEKSGQFDIGEATQFFTIGGVWAILVKTMKLDPQPDVTVMVIQTLLELLSDRLNQVYGIQFQKLMGILISMYLPRINKISTGPSQSGVVRFKTFLEQKFTVR